MRDSEDEVGKVGKVGEVGEVGEVDEVDEASEVGGWRIIGQESYSYYEVVHILMAEKLG